MLIAIVLHILDRQGDFVARTDFLWKAKLKTEQEEVETMRGINKVTFYDFHFSILTVSESRHCERVSGECGCGANLM